MKIEETTLKIGDLISPNALKEFQEGLKEVLTKTYMDGYEKGYRDASQVARKAVGESFLSSQQVSDH